METVSVGPQRPKDEGPQGRGTALVKASTVVLAHIRPKSCSPIKLLHSSSQGGVTLDACSPLRGLPPSPRHERLSLKSMHPAEGQRQAMGLPAKIL